MSVVIEGPLELVPLERDVQRARARVEQLRAMLATEAGREEARAFDLVHGVRHAAGRSTYRALVELKVAAHDALLRDALVRWVYELLQARVGADLEIDDADALHAEDERLGPRAGAGVARTYASALRGVLAAEDGARAEGPMARAGELAAPVAAVRSERRARRFEAARRLGLAHPLALSVPSGVELPAAALALLDATEPLALELFKHEKKQIERRWSAAHAVHAALAKGATEGWPARLGARWLDDVFAPLAPRGAPAGRLPEPLGGASFLRAATAWGAGLRAAGAPRSMPASLARDPYPRPAHRFGAAMAVALAEPAMQSRVLGLPSRLAAAQSRALRRSLFAGLRVAAARLLLAWDERPAPDRFEELTTRVFGAPLPAGLAGAWPEPRVDEAARLLAFLDVQAFVRSLVERFDEDWFRNPRAGQHLASLACAPAFDGDPPPEGVAAAIGRAFEEALG